jgi:hypothetical protein
MENRAEIAYAILTLVQHWAAGIPAYERDAPGEDRLPAVRHTPSKLKGTFEEWSRVVGAILQAAGIEGFLENEAEMKSRLDAQTPEVEGFLAALQPLIPEEGILVSEMVKLCRGDLIDLLPTELAGERKDLQVDLEEWLKKEKDGWHGTQRIVPLSRKRSPYRWVVESK